MKIIHAKFSQFSDDQNLARETYRCPKVGTCVSGQPWHTTQMWTSMCTTPFHRHWGLHNRKAEATVVGRMELSTAGWTRPCLGWTNTCNRFLIIFWAFGCPAQLPSYLPGPSKISMVLANFTLGIWSGYIPGNPLICCAENSVFKCLPAYFHTTSHYNSRWYHFAPTIEYIWGVIRVFAQCMLTPVIPNPAGHPDPRQITPLFLLL